MCRMILARYEEYALYRDLLAANCRAAEVEVWAWCPMPNHVHLILMSSDRDGLHRALARVHRCYAGVIRARRKPSGHFWQGRFGAVAVDEEHLAAALRQRVFKRSMPSGSPWHVSKRARTGGPPFGTPHRHSRHHRLNRVN